MEDWGRAVWHGRVKSASRWLLAVIRSLVHFHEVGGGFVTYNTLFYQSLPSVQQLRAADKVKRDTHRGVMHFKVSS